MSETNYYYHSSHGEIIEDNPIVNINLDEPVMPFKDALDKQKIEIVILNRAAVGHTINVAALTVYGDVSRNFNPDLFEEYMKITAIGNEIQEIILGTGTLDVKIFYNKERGIKIPLPNIEFTYNEDFNMGTFELLYDGSVFTSSTPGVNVWDNLCVDKPDNPVKRDYLHSRNRSLLNEIISDLNNDHELLYTMDPDNEGPTPVQDLNIVLFNSSCLHVENAPELYEKFQDWGRMFNVYLYLGQEKLANQQQTKINKLDTDIINYELKKKNYEMMNPIDPGEAQIRLYGLDNVNKKLRELNEKKKKKTQKRLRRTVQSTKIKDLSFRDKLKPTRGNIYRRPPRNRRFKQFGGTNSIDDIGRYLFENLKI